MRIRVVLFTPDESVVLAHADTEVQRERKRERETERETAEIFVHRDTKRYGESKNSTQTTILAQIHLYLLTPQETQIANQNFGSSISEFS